MNSVKLQSAVAPTYFYYFRYQKNPANDYLGISHGDDVFLIYENLDEPEEIEGIENIQMSSLLLDLYGNFSLKNTQIFGNLELTKVEPKNVQYLEIFSPFDYSIVNHSKNFGNIKFWNNLNIEE